MIFRFTPQATYLIGSDTSLYPISKHFISTRYHCYPYYLTAFNKFKYDEFAVLSIRLIIYRNLQYYIIAKAPLEFFIFVLLLLSSYFEELHH